MSALPFDAEQGFSRCILALDLGMNTGWALRNRDGLLRYGTEKFTHRRRCHPGQRWLDFRSWLNRTLDAQQVHVIAYEDVRRHLGTDAAHAYGAFLAVLQMAAASQNIELIPVAVGTIKKHWTGSGSAKKDAMIAEAKRRGFTPDTDNAADALAVLSWACLTEDAE